MTNRLTSWKNILAAGCVGLAALVGGCEKEASVQALESLPLGEYSTTIDGRTIDTKTYVLGENGFGYGTKNLEFQDEDYFVRVSSIDGSRRFVSVYHNGEVNDETIIQKADEMAQKITQKLNAREARK